MGQPDDLEAARLQLEHDADRRLPATGLGGRARADAPRTACRGPPPMPTATGGSAPPPTDLATGHRRSAPTQVTLLAAEVTLLPAQASPVFGFDPNTEVTLVTLVTLFSLPFLVMPPEPSNPQDASRLQREESPTERHQRHLNPAGSRWGRGRFTAARGGRSPIRTLLVSVVGRAGNVRRPGADRARRRRGRAARLVSGRPGGRAGRVAIPTVGARGRSGELRPAYPWSSRAAFLDVAQNPSGPAMTSSSTPVGELLEHSPYVGRRGQEKSSNSVPGGRPSFA